MLTSEKYLNIHDLSNMIPVETAKYSEVITYQIHRVSYNRSFESFS